MKLETLAKNIWNIALLTEVKNQIIQILTTSITHTFISIWLSESSQKSINMKSNIIIIPNQIHSTFSFGENTFKSEEKLYHIFF